MDHDALFANVCETLRREQRISYRALRRRFELSDDDLEDLKDGDLSRARKGSEQFVWRKPAYR